MTDNRTISISSLSDVTGGYGCVDTGIRHVAGEAFLSGKAVTVWTLPGDKNYYDALRAVVQAGDVVVISARGDHNLAAICDGFIAELEKKGVAGIVVDGFISNNLDTSIPVFCRGIFPRMLGYEARYYINNPVSIGGAVVNAGDRVIGTKDGLFVIQQAETESVLSAAADLVKAEEERIKALS